MLTLEILKGLDVTIRFSNYPGSKTDTDPFDRVDQMDRMNQKGMKSIYPVRPGWFELYYQ